LIPEISSRSEMHLYDAVYTAREKRPSLKALILLSERSPTEIPGLVESSEKLSRRFNVHLEQLEPGFFRLHIDKKIWDKKVEGDALVDSEHAGYWVVYTDERFYFMKHVVESLFDGLYPYASRIHLDSLEIRKFFRRLGRDPKLTLLITHVATKGGKYKKRALTWLTYGEMSDSDLKKMRSAEMGLEKLGFQAVDESEIPLLESSVTRDGLVTLEYGTFSGFKDKMVSELIAIAEGWMGFFDNRERQMVEGEIRLRPYAVRYPNEISDRQIGHLMRSLGSAYCYSIIHYGNPYFVGTFCDYKEGSSLGLTILGNEVTITPMSRATPSGLWEFTGRVQKAIGDGEVMDIGIPPT